MSLALYRLGRFASRHPWRIVGAWVLVSVVVIASSSAFGKDLEDSFDVPGLDSQIALDLLESAQSDQAGLTAQVVAAPSGGATSFFDSPEAVAELEELHAELSALENVIFATDPAAAIAQGADVAISNGLVSADGGVALITVQYPVVQELSFSDLEHLKDAVSEADESEIVQVEGGGELFFTFEQPETGVGEMIGLIVAVIVLLVAFGSVIAMGLPIGMALFGLALGIFSMSLVAHLVEVPSWAPQMAAMIGLGVGIDYALFVVTRHRENMAKGMSVHEAVGRATATAGQSVIFAGGTVVVAILGMSVAGVPFMTAAAIATSVIVLIMVIASVTLLPAFLGFAGLRLTRSRFRKGGQAVGAASPTWDRWGRHVSKHAWPYAIGVTALLLGLSAPVLALNLSFPDAGTFSENRTERRAYDLVAEGFGPGVNGPLLIAVDISQDATIVDELFTAIEADPGVVGLGPTQVSEEAGVATLVAFPDSKPQDDATLDTVNRLRDEVFPAVLADSPATAHVGGQTANFADVGGRVVDRLPLFIATVILISFLLLTLVFRSILVPLKAALLNLLSIGAAYGVLVMVFQWGWGKELIGLDATVPIVSFMPMFMFAVLFGLSMDYEVFLLSRVREEYSATGDNQHSVIHGLATTARVITSAALIMISVFLGFVFGDDVFIKMMGLGLATAIFVDATIVRVVLVPATMKLMGDANWWLPGWLDRILPKVDIEGSSIDELPVDEDEASGTDEREEALV